MTRARRLLTLAVLTTLASSGSARQVEFTRRPTATRSGSAVKIDFEVSRATDVTVRVENAHGRVIRHLASGMLGANPPAPLLPNALAQSVTWNGNDDFGSPATAGPFTVSVSLGLSPRLDNVIGWSGQKLDEVNGLAAGPDGTLYVITSSGLYAHRQTWLILAFDPAGRYLRQVFPGPANLPSEKRHGWPRIALDDGQVPVVFHLLPRTTYPGAVLGRRMFPAVTRDGRFVMLSAPKHTTIKYPDLRGGRRLLILGTDGAVPEDFLGPEVCPMVGGFGHVALSPDDRHVYVTGLVDTGPKGKGPCNVVYRLALDGSEPSRIIVGRMYAAGDKATGLNDPQGIATDRDGNVYVADYGNHRIAVFTPEGSYVDEIEVDCPDGVQVSRKTGAVYVVEIEPRLKEFSDQHYYVPAHNWKTRRVVKIASLADKREVAEFVNPLTSKYGGGAQFTLDESGPEPILWVTGLKYQGGPVFKIVDKGNRLEPIGTPIDDLAAQHGAEHLGFIGDAAVTGRRVISRHPAFGMHTNTSFVYDADSGRYLGTYVPKQADGRPENMWTLLYGEMVAGRDGNLYVHSRNNVIRRYDPRLAPRIASWTICGST
ncbi:MAG: SMP-30/gluconolactonase/LRE family protein [Planctomycetota bacterium]|jgi:hypothetical protein